jgi:hypothetical protein
MKLIAMHDRHGTITALTSAPPDAPRASIAVGPGDTLTDVEVEDGALDISRMETEQRALETLREFRVEVRTEAKLVRRKSQKSR